MYEIIIVLLLLVSVAIVSLILVQQGKGAGMGASFGAGASNTVFGAAGSGNFLTRSTWILALVFFGICLLIGYLQKQDNTPTSNFTNIESEVPAVEDVPMVESTDAPALDTVDNETTSVEMPAVTTEGAESSEDSLVPPTDTAEDAVATESAESTEATVEAEATESTEATESAEATVEESTEATEATESTENAEATEAEEATEENNEAPAAEGEEAVAQ